jgi:hypothetical protein
MIMKSFRSTIGNSKLLNLMCSTFIFEDFLAKVTEALQAEWPTLLRNDELVSALVDIAKEIRLREE